MEMLHFSNTPDDLEVYTDQLTHSFTANGIDNAPKQCVIILTMYSMAAYKLLKTLAAPTALQSPALGGYATFQVQLVRMAARRIDCKFCFASEGPHITL